MELQVNETLPVIACNFDAIEAQVEGILVKYTGLVVAEDDVAAIKSEMAGLNKLKDQLDTARKGTVKRVSVPIKAFDDRVKALMERITIVRGGLDEQVKKFEQQARDAKRNSVQFIIDAAKDEHGVASLNIPIQESWLNKTAKPATVKAEVAAIILKHMQVEREREELLRARQERAFSVEQQVQQMNATHGTAVPVSTFQRLTDSDAPLAEVYEAIEQHFGRITAQAEAQRQRAEQLDRERAEREAMQQQTPHPTAEPQQHPQGAVPPAAAPTAVKQLVIVATYEAADGPQIQALCNELRSLCTAFNVKVTEVA